MLLLAVSVQYKVAALETGFHFPYVLRVISLRSVHCITNMVLAHRGCLLGTANEPKWDRLALRPNPFLQPYVHEVILSPASRSEVNGEPTKPARRPVSDIGVATGTRIDALAKQMIREAHRMVSPRYQ